MNHPNIDVMKTAIAVAKDNYRDGGHAVAAIIVKDNDIFVEAYTTINRDQDPTAHAEINAIRQAAAILQSKKLEDCYLYTTYEPCPMCASAAIWARMKGIVYGASREDQTEAAPWRVYIPAEQVLASGTPKLELYPNFLRDECKNLLNLKPPTQAPVTRITKLQDIN